MSKIKDENYFVIHGWMINRLQLKGTELCVYAIIYGFTQDGENWFEGSRQYLADFTGVSKVAIDGALSRLIEKGLLVKEEIFKNNVKFNNYKVAPVQETLPPPSKNFTTPVQETLPHNNRDNTRDSYNNTPPIYTPPQNETEQETEDDELPFDENDIPPFLTPEDIAEMKKEAKKQKQQKRQEQPVFTDTISELKHRLNTLYCRRETTAWSKKEIISLKEISKRNGVLDEMTEIENLYNSGYQYARRDIKTLLNNWTTELDRARLKNKPRRLAWS